MIAEAKLQDRSSETWQAVNNFLRWLEDAGPASYDPYDVWGTRYGVLSRRLYYRAPVLGLPLVAPILLMEIVFPGLRALFLRKQRYATADGQLALAFLNLYELTGEVAYLEKAVALGHALVRSSIPGFNGYCWGYPFDWQNNTALWRKDTPFITTAPYCFEAFLKLYEITREPGYRDAAESVAKFVHSDLQDSHVSDDAAAASYSPGDTSKVINASAYRAFVLFEAAFQLGMDHCKDKAELNLTFVLQSQRADGSWLYALDSPGEAFIDHFHTCFVLKNLWKINRRLRSSVVAQAIRKGYDYYRRELFDRDDNPKSFTIQPRTQLVRLDMYNLAEAITLGVLLRQDNPEAFALAKKLGTQLKQKYQLPDGYFVTRVYIGGFKHTLPFLRWPQSQLFYALTNLLSAITPQDGGLPKRPATTLARAEIPTHP